MKIALVAPSPVPFIVGGIENMMFGLYKTITQETKHQVELIKLPTKELAFWDLIDSYYQFYSLDLSQFDVVISSKYPAWMVQHDHCIFYMAHRLRGLYDTYHMMNQPEEVVLGNAKIDAVLDYMMRNPKPRSLDTFFDMLFKLKAEAGEAEQPYFAFPGPFIRKIVHYMDGFAMTRPKRRRCYSISETVKARKEYFPPNEEVEVVYLPSSKEEYGTGNFDYIFMVSRLDAPKRIDLLVRAMKYVKSDIPLYIAGTGPERENLEKIAKGDKRIHFLGFVSDEEVEKYYANSLVIPYFPFEEDYGLITIEAMMHHKPVITTKDSGGPTEFVKNGETGFIVELDPKEIAKRIDELAENREMARKMGENAYDLVKDITWKNLIDRILNFNEVDAMKMTTKKIVVTSNFPIYPPQGGGQARIYNLYREMAHYYDVEILSYTNFDQEAFFGNIAEGLCENRIPRTLKHQEKIWNMEAQAGLPLTDIAEITLGGTTERYVEALKAALDSCSLCVISHPYLYPVAKEHLNGKPFVYEAHNVESLMKEQMLPDSKIKKTLVQQVFATEKECCEKAVFVMACSEEDRQKLHEVYGTPLEKIIVVPNGVSVTETPFVSQMTRTANKAALGLDNEKIGLFMGSWHGPNLEACEMLFEVAKKCPETKFMLMGSQCAYFKERVLPENVALLGVVSEEVKKRVFAAVDFAFNPMLSGSGTNLKMFDYMSAGIPIITTRFGTRGIDNKDIFILADTVDEMAKVVRDFDIGIRQDVLTTQARAYAEEHFDWRGIAKVIVNKLNNKEYCEG